MTIIDRGCWERGCACYDSRIADETVEVVEKRPWVGLTAEEVLQCWEKAHEPGNKEHINAIRMADEVEAKLKEKNCG
jgi:hypothetical protein